MAITSKSLHHSNVVIVFDETRFEPPDNKDFSSLYGGEDARGLRFLEDPILQTKILALPEAKLKVTLEGFRLRVDDDSDNEPKNSRIIKDVISIKERLFQKIPIAGFGFNYDILYRFNNVMPIQEMFGKFFSGKILESRELRHMGIQFTLESKKGEIADTWFFKIVSPLELAVHLNRHFRRKELPGEKNLVALFGDCYTNDTDEVVNSFESNLSFE